MIITNTKHEYSLTFDERDEIIYLGNEKCDICYNVKPVLVLSSLDLCKNCIDKIFTKSFKEQTDVKFLMSNLREKRGWTQKVLAEKLNVSLVTIKFWETGKRNPNEENIAKILELERWNILPYVFHRVKILY